MQFQLAKFRGMTLISTPLLEANLTPSWFDLNWWKSQGGLISSAPGRGQSQILRYRDLQLVWRHYRRGGLMARLSADRYLWCGLKRTRPYRELALTATLYERGLPVPRPLGARILHQGLTYRCDLLTERLPDVRPLDQRLDSGQLQAPFWFDLGKLLRHFHAEGLDHVDLNVRNILVADNGQSYLIDFDRCRLRPPGPWAQGNLRRLRRSLDKHLNGADFTGEWQALLRGYQAF